MGGSIPFKSTSYNKQAQYLNPILHSWAATKSGRDRAMPHIKVEPPKFEWFGTPVFLLHVCPKGHLFFLSRWDMTLLDVHKGEQEGGRRLHLLVSFIKLEPVKACMGRTQGRGSCHQEF